ncbi:MAG TPA: HD domain-containing phosphohydrolase, partial [Trueperaceae bacterium]
ESFSSEHAFDEEALEYAASFATQIAVVLQRLELQQDAERRARYQHTLARVERLLLEFAGLDAFFKPLADIILGTDDIGAERVGVYRLRSDGSFAGELFGVPADVAQTALAELRERRMLDLEAGEGPIARAGRRGELSYIPDRSREPHDARSAVGSQLLLPVFRQGGLWGVFELLSSETDAFSPAARDFLAQVGRSIELALDKQASREELQREYERLQVVSAAHARLLGARSLDEAYACAVEALVRETPATGASLLLYRPHDSTLRTVASAGTMPRRRKDVALQRDAGPAWKIFDARRTLQLHGRVGQAGVGPSGSNAGESGANVLGSPLQDDAGQVVGVLLAQVPQGERFSPGDTSFVEAISQACTSAIIRLNLLERSEKEAEAYRSLAQFGATIEEINEADQLIDLGLRRLQEQLGFDCAHYHRLRSGMLEVVTVTGYEDKELLEEWQKRPLALGEGLIGQAALSGEMAYVPAYRDWEHRLASTHQDISTALAIPVRRGDQVVSVVALHCVGAVRPMRKEQLSIARNFVKRLENALERADALHEVSATRESTFRSLGVMLEYRDFETKGHTDRVVELSLQLGRKLGFDREQLRALRWGAYLHDIGKIAIPDQILLKPGRLETQEFEIIRRHTVIGTEMCRNIPFLPTETRQIVRSHHERWDGGGYPDALMGNEVPLMARIFAIIDVYDALASARPYKEAWSREAAVTEILAQAGRQFDPELVPVFVELVMQRREPEL